MELKDLLGGKGANLAEMMSVLQLPVPHGFTISTDACRAYMHGGWPKALDDEMTRQVASLEKDGPQTWGCTRPSVGLSAFWRKVLNARNDGHSSELGAE